MAEDTSGTKPTSTAESDKTASTLTRRQKREAVLRRHFKRSETPEKAKPVIEPEVASAPNVTKDPPQPFPDKGETPKAPDTEEAPKSTTSAERKTPPRATNLGSTLTRRTRRKREMAMQRMKTAAPNREAKPSLRESSVEEPSDTKVEATAAREDAAVDGDETSIPDNNDAEPAVDQGSSDASSTELERPLVSKEETQIVLEKESGLFAVTPMNVPAEEEQEQPVVFDSLAAAQANDESDGEAKNDAKEDSFDFRSIHDHPPAQSASQPAEDTDPSWDTNKVYFNEYVDPNDQRQNAAIFEAAANWTPISDDPFGMPRTDGPGDGALLEEKKEKDPSLEDIMPVQPPVVAIDDDEVDPTGWPRPQQGFLDAEPEDPFKTGEVALLTQNDSDEEDDENLLSTAACRSEAGVTEILGDYGETAAPDEKEKRIDAYATLEPDNASLEGQSSDDEGESSVDDSDGKEDVEYEMQGDMDQDEEEPFLPAFDGQPLEFNEIVDSAPAFEPAVVAATMMTAGDADGSSRDKSSEEFPEVLNAGGPCSEPPPATSATPPRPPPRTAESSTTARSSTAIPLLAPPSGEKLKSWEESKQQSVLRPEPSKQERDESSLAKKESFDAVFHAGIDSPAMETSDGVMEASTQSDVDLDVILNSATQESDHALMSTEDECAESQASPHSPPATTSPSNTTSPVSSAAVMCDSLRAERYDEAISQDSRQLEERAFQQPPEEDEDAKLSLDNLMGPPSAAKSGSERSSPAEAVEASASPRESPSVPRELDNVVAESKSGSATSLDSNEGPNKPVDVDATKRRWVVPSNSPSPFECMVHAQPKLISHVLSFLGDPVAVCRMKMTCRSCRIYVEDDEHRLMRDAVRIGGLSMNVRPYFWLWVAIQKSAPLTDDLEEASRTPDSVSDLQSLERIGREGKWHHVIERDVSRSFGNLPPHKTGARLRTDSIVRALVTWGKNRLMKRGVRGSGDPPPASRSDSLDSDDVSLTPTDTVSDWGGVTPVGSFTSSVSGGVEPRIDKPDERSRRRRKRISCDELALGGNALTDEMKASLQEKLSFILHALAAAHTDVGYCQGMDYVVAHLLRILQDTVRWKAANGTLPEAIVSAPKSFYGQDMDSHERLEMYAEIDRSLVVEETCFRVMDSFFSKYNLRHFYWPELRCLKTCCLVFERLIQIKLPVLADHFDHHELNVGLFALGWFQTLFLYLPSMPSATVCHMWDIWLVERSFKIFFRVGTAILFLSQPILLNHELEGMLSYLNTFPDATLLSPDILIACALQIKVTNRMLMELENDIVSGRSTVAVEETIGLL